MAIPRPIPKHVDYTKVIKTHFLLLPETHKIELHDLVRGGTCQFCPIRGDGHDTYLSGVIEAFGTENNEKINDYELAIPKLSRAVLAKLVSDLGGMADEAQMLSETYRYRFLRIFSSL